MGLRLINISGVISSLFSANVYSAILVCDQSNVEAVLNHALLVS